VCPRAKVNIDNLYKKSYLRNRLYQNKVTWTTEYLGKR